MSEFESKEKSPMSAILFKEVNYSLSGLMQYIEMGQIGLPEIQRPFVWPNAKVRDLFDSMYRGFPVGYLLFWATGSGNGHKQIGAGAKQKIAELLIVDGQQRLTSLFAVMKGIPVIRDDYRTESICVAFNPLAEKFEVTDAAIRKDPEYIPNVSEVWSSGTGVFDLADQYLARLRAVREVPPEEEKKIKKAINNLDNIENYPFTALEISSAANEEQVADIFVRVNSKGTPLNQADFILTLMSVHWDEGRTELEKFCRNSHHPSLSGPSAFNYYIQPDPDQLLRVCIAVGFRRARLSYAYLILRGKDLETEQYSDERREVQFQVLKKAQEQVLDLQNWHEFFKAIRQAGYVSNQMISSANALLYSYAFFLIGKCHYGVKSHLLRNTIARWYFMTALTGRYSGSFESIMEQDLNRFREVKTADEYIQVLDQIIQDSLTDDFWSISLPNSLATSAARGPSLFAYYAALINLGASVLFSDLPIAELLNPAIKAKKSALERHHLFPRGYLEKLGISDVHEANQIANFALVEWSDNIEISDKSPQDYFPEFANRYEENEWKNQRFLHALPKGWEKLEYSVFLAQRRKGIAQVIRKGFLKLHP
jgi:hypothetical protein